MHHEDSRSRSRSFIRGLLPSCLLPLSVDVVSREQTPRDGRLPSGDLRRDLPRADDLGRPFRGRVVSPTFQALRRHHTGLCLHATSCLVCVRLSVLSSRLQSSRFRLAGHEEGIWIHFLLFFFAFVFLGVFLSFAVVTGL